MSDFYEFFKVCAACVVVIENGDNTGHSAECDCSGDPENCEGLRSLLGSAAHLQEGGRERGGTYSAFEVWDCFCCGHPTYGGTFTAYGIPRKWALVTSQWNHGDTTIEAWTLEDTDDTADELFRQFRDHGEYGPGVYQLRELSFVGSAELLADDVNGAGSRDPFGNENIWPLVSVVVHDSFFINGDAQHLDATHYV